MQFVKQFCLRDEWTMPSFSLMFPAATTSQSTSNISPVDASMTLGGMHPLNDVRTDVVVISDIVASADSNEIVTAFASLDTEAEDVESDGLPLEFQCRYRQGKCSQPRTLKKNGSMHSYCEYHRQLSVRNQRAFDEKKRRERREIETEEVKKRLRRSRRQTSDSCVRNVEK